MNKTFTPVLMGAQIQGTGMKHPRVPKVYVGSELNGFVQGDLMDANAISQFISEKTHGLSDKLDQFGEMNDTVTNLQTELQTIQNNVVDIVEDINNLGTIEEHLQDLQDIVNRLNELEEEIRSIGRPTVTGDEVVFS